MYTNYSLESEEFSMYDRFFASFRFVWWTVRFLCLSDMKEMWGLRMLTIVLYFCKIQSYHCLYHFKQNGALQSYWTDRSLNHLRCHTGISRKVLVFLAYYFLWHSIVSDKGEYKIIWELKTKSYRKGTFGLVRYNKYKNQRGQGWKWEGALGLGSYTQTQQSSESIWRRDRRCGNGAQ